VRKRLPIEIRMQAIPAGLASIHEPCPEGCASPAGAVGLVALRLVFRCHDCGTRFYRSHRPASMSAIGSTQQMRQA
jgi:hypothetical protein